MGTDPGYVYILYNPSAASFVKIGKTTREPEERADELSKATGVPTPFIVVYKAYFSDCSAAEAFVHSYLSDKRVSTNKEFFHSSVQDAIKAVIAAENQFSKREEIYEPDSNIKIVNKTESKDFTVEDMRQNIIEQADAYYYGWDDDILQDYSDALSLYKQAAKLGSAEAFHKVGDMYYHGDGVVADKNQALKYYREAVKLGEGICWGDLAQCYYELENYGNSDKCYDKLFSSPSIIDKKNEFSIGRYVNNFINFMYYTKWYPHNKDLLAYYNEMIKNLSDDEIIHLAGPKLVK